MKLTSPFGTNASLGLLARRFYWTAAVIMVLAMIIGLLEGAGVGLLIPLLSTFTDGSSAHGGALGFIERIAQGHARNERLLIVSAMILAFVVLKSVFQIGANIFASWVDGRVGQAIRSALSERLHAIGYAFFLLEEPARLINVITTESWRASDAVRVLLTQISATGTVVVFGILLLVVNWQLSLLVIVGGILTRLVQKRGERKLRDLSARTVATNQVLTDRMLFSVFGARVIRLFDQQKSEHDRLNSSSDEVRRAILRTERLAGTQGPILEAAHGLLFVVVLLVAIFSGTSLPVLAAFLVLMNRLQPHLRIIERSAASFAAAAGHFNEVEWLLRAIDKPQSPGGREPYMGLRREITFDHVTFDYGGRGEPALKGVSFVLRQGQATALMGGSGAGKSTVINLLCRLLEPTSGTISIDSQGLAEINVSEWLRAVAISGQDIDLIDGTIAENISYGRPDMSIATIEESARASYATFVDQMPQGFQTLVGPRGLSLSGGQRQRIGIARALARKPDLLILDEATNAVDHETEVAILQSLLRFRNDMTILVISHRMSTLAICEQAIVLQRGSVVKTGPLSDALEYYATQPGNTDGTVEKSTFDCTATSVEESLANTATVDL
jgi:ATP-binding cassette, subfamily B, bacterial MsbA